MGYREMNRRNFRFFDEGREAPKQLYSDVVGTEGSRGYEAPQLEPSGFGGAMFEDNVVPVDTLVIPPNVPWSEPLNRQRQKQYDSFVPSVVKPVSFGEFIRDTSKWKKRKKLNLKKLQMNTICI